VKKRIGDSAMASFFTSKTRGFFMIFSCFSGRCFLVQIAENGADSGLDSVD